MSSTQQSKLFVYQNGENIHMTMSISSSPALHLWMWNSSRRNCDLSAPCGQIMIEIWVISSWRHTQTLLDMAIQHSWEKCSAYISIKQSMASWGIWTSTRLTTRQFFSIIGRQKMPSGQNTFQLLSVSSCQHIRHQQSSGGSQKNPFKLPSGVCQSLASYSSCFSSCAALCGGMPRGMDSKRWGVIRKQQF